MRERTIANYLQDAGWRTAMFGKWHSGTGEGYDPWYRGFGEGGWLRLYRHQNAIYVDREGEVETGQWADEFIFDRGIEFLREHASEKAFLYLPTMTPHGPLAAPEEYIQRYRRKRVSENLGCLYAMISYLDTQIGKLLKFLDESGLGEDTLIVFTSDNGPAFSGDTFTDVDRRIRKVAHFRGWKGDLWQGAVSVPAFLRWPAGFRPGVVTTPVDQVDLLPTLLSWCGVNNAAMPFPLDGRVVREIVAQQRKTVEVEVPIFNFAHPGWLNGEKHGYSTRGIAREYNPDRIDGAVALDGSRQSISVRLGRYKLVRNPEQPDLNGNRELYSVLFDLVNDPGETTDVSESHPDIKLELERRIDSWFGEIAADEHSFAAPVLVFHGTKLRFPAKLVHAIEGGLQNTVIDLEGWQQESDAAVYCVRCSRTAQVLVTLDWNVPPPPGASFVICVDGRPVEGDVFTLNEGEHLVTIRLARVPAGQRCRASLRAVCISRARP